MSHIFSELWYSPSSQSYLWRVHKWWVARTLFSDRVFVVFYFGYGNNDNCGSCNVTFKTLKTAKRHNALDSDFAKTVSLNNEWRLRFSEYMFGIKITN